MPTLTSVEKTDLSTPVALPGEPALPPASAHKPWLRAAVVLLLIASAAAIATWLLSALFSTPPVLGTVLFGFSLAWFTRSFS